MPGYSVAIEFRGAYNITKPALRNLAEAVEEFTRSTPSVSVQLRGGHTVDSSDLSEIENDLIIGSEFIQKITITASGGGYGSQDYKQARIALGGDALLFTGIASVSAAGPQIECAGFVEKVRRILASCSSWYSFASLPAHPASFFVRAVILGVCSLVLVAAVHVNFRRQVSSEFVIALEVCLAYWFLSTGEQHLFPRITFDLGRSARVAPRANAWRKVLFVTIGLGVAVAVARTYFFGV